MNGVCINVLYCDKICYTYVQLITYFYTPSRIAKRNTVLKLLALRHVSDTAMSDPGMLTAGGVVDVVSITPQMNLGWGPDHELGERAKKVSLKFYTQKYLPFACLPGEMNILLTSYSIASSFHIHPKNYLYIINSTRPLITAALGISDEEYHELFQEIGEELSKGGYQPAHTLYLHYGRKPKEAE